MKKLRVFNPRFGIREDDDILLNMILGDDTSLCIENDIDVNSRTVNPLGESDVKNKVSKEQNNVKISIEILKIYSRRKKGNRSFFKSCCN